MDKKIPKLVILDRDGVINRERGHITKLEDFEILNGVCSAIARLNKANISVCVASNQSGLARGILSCETLSLIQDSLERRLLEQEGHIDHWFYSPWHPDENLEGGVKKWLGEHEDRKPGCGMLKKALSATGIEVQNAIMVGDSAKDAGAASALGIRFLGVKSGKKSELLGEIVYDSLSELVNDILE